jgi:hypothetical protein
MDEKLAKDIHSCEDCPLFNKDCSGGWGSDGIGTPIEPPCFMWDDDTLVYDGMYDLE